MLTTLFTHPLFKKTKAKFYCLKSITVLSFRVPVQGKQVHVIYYRTEPTQFPVEDENRNLPELLEPVQISSAEVEAESVTIATKGTIKKERFADERNRMSNT